MGSGINGEKLQTIERSLSSEPQAADMQHLMQRKSYNDIWAGLLPSDIANTQNDGIRAIALAAQAKQQEQARQDAQNHEAAAAAAAAHAVAQASTAKATSGPVDVVSSIAAA